MRLLHCETLEFKIFHDESVPGYVILSHTWGDQEVSYQEMRFLQRLLALPDDLKHDTAYVSILATAAGLDLSLNDTKSIRDRVGYKKILGTAEIAKSWSISYFWVDTCCIDKTSSAELQEAINSMYKWYRASSSCLVYLEATMPVTRGQLEDDYFQTMLRASRWVTRGWTLQELIAPSQVVFYDQDWNFITSKSMDSDAISSITGIPEYILTTGDLSQASVAQKMSWAADRKTTRIEDQAYSLMGIFAVHMAMLYGEGDKAFRRLQEEIMKTSSDDSIFAWRAPDGSMSSLRGLLANSPLEFRRSGLVLQPKYNRNTYTTLNLGLRIETHRALIPMERMKFHSNREPLYFLVLDAGFGSGNNIVLLLREFEFMRYARIQTNQYWNRNNIPRMDNPTTLFIEHIPEVPRTLKSRFMHCFHLKQSSSEENPLSFAIESVQPRTLWDMQRRELLIPDMYLSDTEDTTLSNPDKIVESTKHFIGMVWFKDVEGPSFQLLLGYEPSTARVWCKILLSDKNGFSWPADNASTCEWTAALHSFANFEVWGTHDKVPAFYTSKACGSEIESHINVNISPGIHRGQLSHIVEVDGLLERSH